MIDIHTVYKHYNFELKQLKTDQKEAFCILYKNKEIAVYDGIVPLEEIKKSQVKYKLDYFFPMDFMRFCNDYFNFRQVISIKFYKYALEKKQAFFFNFSVFDEYCSQLENVIKQGMKDLDIKLTKESEPIDVFNDGFENMHQKTQSLIENIYNKQRTFSNHLIINSRIHTVVTYYPSFGRHYDKMKNELEIFIDNGKDDFLILNKEKDKNNNYIFLAQYFGFERPHGKWEPIELLFNIIKKKILVNTFQKFKDAPNNYYKDIMEKLEKLN
ncbi:MAG: hypothetical protein FWD14_08020 [Treponema sp.]|nr:hypothetical protein [Treponema sp.]